MGKFIVDFRKEWDGLNGARSDPHYIDVLGIGHGLSIRFLEESMNWHVVSTRRVGGALDDWEEFLCIREGSVPDTTLIAICGYEIIGEPPSDWFDDNGVPLPEYQDEHGDLSLPDVWEGSPVSHFDGEYILSDLIPIGRHGSTIVVPNSSDKAALSRAIKKLGWKEKGAVDALVGCLASS